jgi:hypothetical protein
MRQRSRLAVARVRPIAVVALVCLAPLARAQASETISATAHVTSAGGVAATAPVRVVVDRFSTDAERTDVLTALQRDGTEGVRALLATRAAIGSVTVGASVATVKYAYARTTPDGRLITVVTDKPIAFVGAGRPGAKARSGFDLGLVLLEVSAAQPGRGTLLPATKIRLDPQGAIVTDDYSADVVQLSNVIGK